MYYFLTIKFQFINIFLPGSETVVGIKKKELSMRVVLQTWQILRTLSHGFCDWSQRVESNLHESKIRIFISQNLTFAYI